MRVALRFVVVVAFAGMLAGFVVAAGDDGDKKTAAPDVSRDEEVLRDGFETTAAGLGARAHGHGRSGCSSTIGRSGPRTGAGCRSISTSKPGRAASFS